MQVNVLKVYVLFGKRSRPSFTKSTLNVPAGLHKA